MGGEVGRVGEPESGHGQAHEGGGVRSAGEFLGRKAGGGTVVDEHGLLLFLPFPAGGCRVYGCFWLGVLFPGPLCQGPLGDLGDGGVVVVLPGTLWYAGEEHQVEWILLAVCHAAEIVPEEERRLA